MTNRFAYNGAGDLLTLIDGKGQTTTWKYDLYGRVTNKLDTTSAEMFRYGYDANGHLTNRWTPAKTNTFYAYDAVGNLTNIDYQTSTDIRLAYDALNRLINMLDAVGTSQYSYNALGALLTEDGPWDNDTVSYTYDNGRRRNGLSVQAPNATGWTQSYGYDVASRLNSLSSPAGAFSYEYTSVGQSVSPASLVRKITLPNGAAITNSYDGRARLLGTWLRNSSGTPLNKHEYVLNDLDQRITQTRVDSSYVDYTYDPLGQLQTAVGKESGGTTNRWQEVFGYAYDAAGNLNYRTNNALMQTFAVNSLNQLSNATRSGTMTVAGTTTSAATNVTVNTSNAVLYTDATFASTNHTLADGTNIFAAIGKDNLGRVDTNTSTVYLPATVSYLYDANGNLTNDGRRAFFYDDENQLTSIVVTNGWKSEFKYDGKMRRRIRKEYSWQSSAWVLTNEVRYVYDGNLVLQERDGFNLPSVSYARGKDLSGSLEGAGGIGGLLARTDHSTLNTQPSIAHAYFHCDGNGNVTMLINTQQLAVAKYLYDPFGNILSLSGPLAEANLYRFSSKEAHLNSGLAYYLYRFYDPHLQRWPTRDPIEEAGGINLYVVVHNNPISFIDPNGEAVGAIGVAGLGVGAALALACASRPAECAKLLEAIGRGIGSLARDLCKPKPKNDKKKTCTYECPMAGTVIIEVTDDGTPCPDPLDIDGEICKVVPETFPGPPPRR